MQCGKIVYTASPVSNLLELFASAVAGYERCFETIASLRKFHSILTTIPQTVVLVYFLLSFLSVKLESLSVLDCDVEMTYYAPDHNSDPSVIPETSKFFLGMDNLQQLS